MVIPSSFGRYVVAVDRVERLLRDVTDALNAADMVYAIIGGNAVAAWVATVDEAAVRSTGNVDVLLHREDLALATEALRSLNLMHVEVIGVHMFVDRANPNPKTGLHVIFANELVRPHYTHPAPDPSDAVMSEAGFLLIELGSLLKMKLQAHRFIDRAHVQDMISVGLIEKSIRDSLPQDLRQRLDTIEQARES